MSKVKEFLKKHIVITVFLIAVFIAVANYLVYPVLIKKDMNLVDVPVALVSITESTKITEEMITTISISADQLPEGIVTDISVITSAYVAENCKIPANGFFYRELLSSKKNAYGTLFKELKDGEYAYTLAVDKKYDQMSALKAGQSVNIYGIFSTTKTVNGNSSKATLFGQLAENIRIIDVTESGGTEYVTFAVSEEDMSLFTVASSLGEIYPALYYGSDNGTVSTEYFDIESMRQWIKERTAVFTQSVTEESGQE